MLTFGRKFPNFARFLGFSGPDWFVSEFDVHLWSVLGRNNRDSDVFNINYWLVFVRSGPNSGKLHFWVYRWTVNCNFFEFRKKTFKNQKTVLAVDEFD